MAELEQAKTSIGKRARVFAMVPLMSALMLGMLGFYRVATNARFESYHRLDVAQLLISGASFGIALTGLIFLFVAAPLMQTHKN